jgi:hypothetical protein
MGFMVRLPLARTMTTMDSCRDLVVAIGTITVSWTLPEMLQVPIYCGKPPLTIGLVFSRGAQPGVRVALDSKTTVTSREQRCLPPQNLPAVRTGAGPPYCFYCWCFLWWYSSSYPGFSCTSTVSTAKYLLDAWPVNLERTIIVLVTDTNLNVTLACNYRVRVTLRLTVSQSVSEYKCLIQTRRIPHQFVTYQRKSSYYIPAMIFSEDIHVRSPLVTCPFFVIPFYLQSVLANSVNNVYNGTCLLWGEVRWGEVTLRLTVISMSWYRAPLWDLRPDITSCRNVAVWNLWSCICGAPSLTRGRVYNLQCNKSMVRVAQNP